MAAAPTPIAGNIRSLTCANCVPLVYYRNLRGRKAIELIDELVDLIVRCLNLSLEDGASKAWFDGANSQTEVSNRFYELHQMIVHLHFFCRITIDSTDWSALEDVTVDLQGDTASLCVVLKPLPQQARIQEPANVGNVFS